jgi:glutathione S-transferase
MLEIWGRSSSSNVQKVLWCCAELGLDYRRHDIGREFGGNREPAYLAMNPNGLIPTLTDGELVIWESNAILRYLAHRYDGERLYPKSLAARSQVDQWLDWELGTLAPAIFPVFWGLIRTAPEQRDEKALAGATEKLIELWRLLDGQLAKRPYVAGDRLTLADIAMGNSVYRWFAFPIERPKLPMLRAWYDRIAGQPGFKEHIAKPLV